MSKKKGISVKEIYDLGDADRIEDMTCDEFKEKVGKSTSIRFTFATDFHEILQMGYDGHYEHSGVNERVDDIMDDICSEACGSLSDIDYKAVGFDKKSGSIFIQVTASISELELV